MPRSISIVEYKVRQAHFFLEKIAQSELDFFGVQCFVDAFANATRSITFSMQAVVSDVQGFARWYEDQLAGLKEDLISQFFNQYRTVSTHIGDTVVRGCEMGRDNSGRRVVKYLFVPVPDLLDVPAQDVFSICGNHFKTLLELVFNSFIVFRYQLDDRWYYTKENFDRLGKTIEDAEQELGFPRGWTDIGKGLSEAERWTVLRNTQTVGCQLNDLFLGYLGKQVEGPDSGTDQRANEGELQLPNSRGRQIRKDSSSRFPKAENKASRRKKAEGK